MNQNFEIFDAHMHYNGIFMGKGRTIIEYMDENGIDFAILNTLNTQANLGRLDQSAMEDLMFQIKNPEYDFFSDFRKSGQPDHTIVSQLMQQYPDRLFPFYWYNPNDPNDPDHEKGLQLVKNSLDSGFKGVKLQLAMTLSKLEDLFPVAELLIKRDLPLYIHPSGGICASKQTPPKFFVDLAKQFPDLKIIIGHAGCTMEFCIETVLSIVPYPNIYVETSSSIPYSIVTYLKVLGENRVLFGSDAPSAGPFMLEFQKVALLQIPDSIKQKIFSENLKTLILIP
jgi:predicted TIM-barrel fold metal-dependent hydrolase